MARKRKSDEPESAAPPTADGPRLYRTRSKPVRATRHAGPPRQVTTAEGAVMVYAGMYVVEVGTVTRTRFVPPAEGRPGGYVSTDEPALGVMSAKDFESQYEPA